MCVYPLRILLIFLSSLEVKAVMGPTALGEDMDDILDNRVKVWQSSVFCCAGVRDFVILWEGF